MIEISRSEQKRRMKRAEQLVDQLAGLPGSVIARLPCDAEIRGLLQEAAGMKGGVRKRQVKFITKQLRDAPLDTLYTFLSEKKGAALQERKEFHELEYYRDSLLNEAITLHRIAEENQEEMNEEWTGRVMDEIAGELPAVDRQSLVRLAYLFARTRNRKYSREIFRLLRAAQEQKKVQEKTS